MSEFISIRTKVVGVTFVPPANYQEMYIGQELQLVREPDNKVDPYAVMVLRSDGRKLGYISAKLGINRELSEALLAGTQFTVKVLSCTGDWLTKPGIDQPVLYSPHMIDMRFGVNIEIKRKVDS